MIVQIKKKIIYSIVFQTIVKDFTARCKGIVQEAMKWAPQATRSHLQEYIKQLQSSEMYHQSGLALATDSVLELVELSSGGPSLGPQSVSAYSELIRSLMYDELDEETQLLFNL